jgi:DNA helicase II / ATP-dependent DNA helicase PcrA
MTEQGAFMDMLAGLNPAQTEAVTTVSGPLLILAGPGSGKTRVIAHRIAYLVRQTGVAPWRILAVTFTNKAAKEMRARVESLLGERSARAMALGTFHARCARILREDGGAVGVDPRFTIYDDDDQVRLIKQALLDLSVDQKRYSPRAILSTISRAKNEMVSAAAFARSAEDYFQEIVARAYARYQELLEQSHALDFDDLLLYTVRLFDQNESIRRAYQQKYEYVLIDEFQDTNVVQYSLARLLSHPDMGGNSNICVVGDEDQSIYSWRSARPENFIDLEQDFPDVKVVKLEQNYRSTQVILDAAQEVIARGGQRHQKNLWTENGEGNSVVIYEAEDAEDEGRFIRDEIVGPIRRGERRPRDFAVMYRTNAQSRAIEDAMTTSGVPYRLVGGTRFWERQEIRDLVAYLRVVQNPFDSMSLLRIINTPQRGVGKTTLDRLQRWASDMSLPMYTALQVLGDSSIPSPSEINGRIKVALLRFVGLLNDLVDAAPGLTPPQLIKDIIDRIGYRSYLTESFDNGDERWENVQQLIAAAEQYDAIDPQGALSAFLENAALVADVDEMDDRGDAVTLITLHAAKGLEFPVVFLAGMEEALLPHIRSYDTPEQMEEERRLCYVGITRAKEQLYLSHARFRVGFGGGQHNPRSRFVEEIPARLTVTRTGEDRMRVYRPNAHQRGAASPWTMPARVPANVTPSRPSSATAAAAAVRAAFDAGDRVSHAKFGDGIVVSCKPSGDDQLIEVAFKGGVGVKKLMLSFAGLQKA